VSAYVNVYQRISASFINEIYQRVLTGQDQAGLAVRKKQVAAEIHYSELKLKAEDRATFGRKSSKMSIGRQQPRFNFKLKIGVRVKILILATGQ